MRPRDIGTIPSIATTRYRPLGSSIFKQAPWSTGAQDKYIPSKMTFNALRVGLIKSNQLERILPEHLVVKAQEYVINKLRSIWIYPMSESVITYDEALQCVTESKSPGYPFFYNHQTKRSVLEDEGDAIRRMTGELLAGVKLPCLFNLTLKSELRPVEKVELDKTRVFMASPLHHLMACYQLFTKQNDYLMDNRSMHPITIGIQLPGPEFIRRVSQLGLRLNDGDVSGCDLRFNLRLARVIRDIRMSFLPMRYRKAVNHLYNTVYCGISVCSGNLYRIYGNKSGWHNTGHDNSLQVWLWLIMASFHFAPLLNPESIFKALINGDDLLIAWLHDRVSFHEVCLWMEGYLFYIEAENWAARPADWCVFLSHHIEERFVSGFGDILVAAGNLPKLLSSLNWIKTNRTLSFEESCVAHLIGIRFCLFPWAIYFEECDELLSNYLESIQITPFIRNCLQARFNEKQLALLHTRMEGFIFPLNSGIREIDKALKGIPDHLIKLIESFCPMTKTKAQKQRNTNARKNAVRVARGLAPPIPKRRGAAAPRRKGPSRKSKSVGKTEGRIAKIGRYIGTGAKAFFKAVTGFGDYQVATNSIMAKNEVPIVSNPATTAGVVVRHREYVQDINSHEAFTNVQFDINPGLPELFPWLSTVASNFEEYQIRGMIFEFKTMASPLNSATTTSSLGTVIMATDYNVLNPVFPDKRTMENYEFACSSKPSESFIHPLECSKNQSVNTHLFVRTSEDFGVTGDQRLYDMGSFQIACQGMPVDFEDTSVGELWCTYEVEFFKPRLSGDTGVSNLVDTFVVPSANGAVTGQPFGTDTTAYVAKDGSTCGCVIDNASIKFPPTCHGRFLVFMRASNVTAAGSTTPHSVALVRNATVVFTRYTANNTSILDSSTPPTLSCQAFTLYQLVDVTNSNGVDGGVFITYAFTSAAAGNWTIDLNIIQVTPNFHAIAPTKPPSLIKSREDHELEGRLTLIENTIKDIVLNKTPGDRSLDSAFTQMTDQQRQELIRILGSK